MGKHHRGTESTFAMAGAVVTHIQIGYSAADIAASAILLALALIVSLFHIGAF